MDFEHMEVSDTRCLHSIELPDGSKVDLTVMDEYATLGRSQQLFLSEYCRNFLKKTITCFKIRVSPGTIDKWLTEDDDFAACYLAIHELFGDVLEGNDYQAALSDGKRRDKVLSNLNRKGYKQESKGSLPGVYNDNRSVIMINGKETEGFQGAKMAAKFLKEREDSD